MSLVFSNYTGNEKTFTKYDQIWLTVTVPYSVSISQIIINASGGLNNGGYVVCNIWVAGTLVHGQAYSGINSIIDTVINKTINIDAGQTMSIQWSTMETYRYLTCYRLFGEVLPVRITYSPRQAISFSLMQSRYGVDSNIPLNMSLFSRSNRLPRISTLLSNNIPVSNSNQSMGSLIMCPFNTRTVVSKGYYGTAPWYGISNFPDGSAQWLWTDYQIDQKWFCFWKYFYLSRAYNVRAYLAADNYGTLFIDGIERVYNDNWGYAYNSDIVWLSEGLHCIEVNCAEASGSPTAFIACLTDSDYGGIVVRTDTSWRCTDHSISFEQELKEMGNTPWDYISTDSNNRTILIPNATRIEDAYYKATRAYVVMNGNWIGADRSASSMNRSEIYGNEFNIFYRFYDGQYTKSAQVVYRFINGKIDVYQSNALYWNWDVYDANTGGATQAPIGSSGYGVVYIVIG
jgi:hypothetical protein